MEKPMENIVIIGAGLIGATLSFQLARSGRAVTVVEAGLPAQAASGRSFGWINASFALSEAHFALRVAGMAAHERLAQAVPGHHRASGCLWWEEAGAAFEATATRLQAAGYPLERLGRAGVLAREPALKTPPKEALFFPTEGWVDAAALTHALLAASGAQVLSGVSAQVVTKAGKVTGVSTALGSIAADQVVIAAGIGAPALLAPLGLTLPMLHRPGLMLRTAPVALRLSHILAAPEQEIRQDAEGCLLAPAAAFHQSDEGGNLADPLAQAEAAMARIGALLGLSGLQAERVVQAERPVPGDGLPVVGPVPGVAGLWLSVMHSGVTLAAIAAEGLAGEMAGRGVSPVLRPFQPVRLLHST
jgi:glycine/D-amino acid oxidase-like deaminating enzyme